MRTPILLVNSQCEQNRDMIRSGGYSNKIIMIDALFGSKTRVKLLHLFMNNPGKSFYVREITRLIDEQINSVRRELSNLLNTDVIITGAVDASDNKLYYEVNQRYEHYLAFRSIFAGTNLSASSVRSIKKVRWQDDLAEALPSARIILASGVLVPGSNSKLDLLIIGSEVSKKVKMAVSAVEKSQGRALNYATMPYDEFYYRLSVRDRFITELLANKYSIVADTDDILKNQNKED